MNHLFPSKVVTIQPLRRKGTKEKIEMNSMKHNVPGFLIAFIYMVAFARILGLADGGNQLVEKNNEDVG